MRKVRFVLMFVSLTLLLSIGTGAVLAQKLPPKDPAVPDLPGMDGPVSEWVDTDLTRLVDLAVDEQITVPQAQAVWEQLNEEQREKVGEFLALKTGVPLEEWRQFVRSNKTRRPSKTPGMSMLSLAPLGFPGEIPECRQPIENVWVWSRPPLATFASAYWSSPGCDDDYGDDDWAFRFNREWEWYSRNPDGLRWTTTSAQVYLAFMAAYGGNLNGYAFAWTEERLCIGTGGVSAAGGPAKVQQTTYLHPNN